MLSGINNGNNHASTISEGVEIEGKIHFSGPVKIDGSVIGDIISEETLTIGKEGNVESNIKTKNIIISGRLNGNIAASGLVAITSTGSLTGNISQEDAMLKIEKGGIFKGKSIIKEKEVVPLNTLERKKNKAVKMTSVK
jgi:cytoskeletal protein CcmA (bactofilin family)